MVKGAIMCADFHHLWGQACAGFLLKGPCMGRGRVLHLCGERALRLVIRWPRGSRLATHRRRALGDEKDRWRHRADWMMGWCAARISSINQTAV